MKKRKTKCPHIPHANRLYHRHDSSMHNKTVNALPLSSQATKCHVVGKNYDNDKMEGRGRERERREEKRREEKRREEKRREEKRR
jgi:hypothetical protein